MRRNDKEISDKDEIYQIMQKERVCRIGLSDGKIPYVIPVNYGFAENKLYFHSSKKGRKIDILKKNNNICFEIDTDIAIIKSGLACKWGMQYKCVIGFGTASFIEDQDEKKRVLEIIMKHYEPNGRFSFSEKALEDVALVEVSISKITGKQSGL